MLAAEATNGKAPNRDEARGGDNLHLAARQANNNVCSITLRTFSSGHAGLLSSVGLGLYVSRPLARTMDGDLQYSRREGTTDFA